MGYYSTFEVVDTNMDVEELVKLLNTFDELYWGGSPGWELIFPYGEQVGYIRGYDSTKWYDWVSDLEQLANHYPDLFLIILREGEESPDMSRVIVKNGHAFEQYPEITWPDY